ncbi:MAG: hypothetical protein CSA11_07895 [Chloroflexi bacterium]|nr:MAG: hypothetical protein CSB13_10370 [Chloroflexota bacterium]PIE80514.1 MAG: hypothetical protein CSA11_07895 [Chloroflexota bacterium]
MAETIALIFLIPAAMITLISLLVAVTYLWPQRSNQASQALDKSPGRSFIIGFVNLLFFGILATFLLQQEEFAGLLALILILILAGIAGLGMGGFLLLLTTRIFPQAEDLWKARLKTAVLLILALSAPILGWFIFTPLLLILSLGAGITALFRRAKPQVEF